MGTSTTAETPVKVTVIVEGTRRITTRVFPSVDRLILNEPSDGAVGVAPVGQFPPADIQYHLTALSDEKGMFYSETTVEKPRICRNCGKEISKSNSPGYIPYPVRTWTHTETGKIKCERTEAQPEDD